MYEETVFVQYYVVKTQLLTSCDCSHTQHKSVTTER